MHAPGVREEFRVLHPCGVAQQAVLRMWRGERGQDLRQGTRRREVCWGLVHAAILASAVNWLAEGSSFACTLNGVEVIGLAVEASGPRSTNRGFCRV